MSGTAHNAPTLEETRVAIQRFFELESERAAAVATRLAEAVAKRPAEQHGSSPDATSRGRRGAHGEPEAEDVVRPVSNNRSMYGAEFAATEAQEPIVREYRWNWGMAIAVVCCVAFWTAVIYGLVALP